MEKNEISIDTIRIIADIIGQSSQAHHILKTHQKGDHYFKDGRTILRVRDVIDEKEGNDFCRSCV
jgi:hypothetical protein